jgi:two-component system NtrC family sensor kinase
LSEFDYLIEDFPKVLASMQVGAERISQIVVSLLNFSSLNQGQKDLVNIHDAIENTLLIMENHFKTNDNHREISIVKNYGCLPMIECYPQELNQVFINIIKNAIDALQDSNVENPQIRISTYMVAGNCSMSNLPGSITIQIADNGSGIAETIRAKIFDPFFTTKDVGQGTGLGLSISYQIIVERHGGTIDCTSVPGEGSEFVIKIPLHKSILPTRIQDLV